MRLRDREVYDLFVEDVVNGVVLIFGNDEGVNEMEGRLGSRSFFYF